MTPLGLPRQSGFGTALPAQQEVRAYEPSWRDRLATALMGWGVPEQSVEGLVASRGLGQTDKNMGMGLVDMTPLGAPLWLNEAERARGAGDMGGQMFNTLAAVPIPGAKAGAKLLEEGVDAAKTGIRAYHGSPHDFDKFDMSKIGTGEGAQAYGHGLYLAENEGVAQAYRNSTTQGRGITGPTYDGSAVWDAEPDKFDAVVKLATYGNRAEAKAAAIKEGAAPNVIKQIEQLDPQKASWGERSRMYEARINASPDEFLDWDKPLSEQPEAVQAALAGIDNPMFAAWKKSGAWPHVKGETLYRELAGGLTNKAHAEGKHVTASELTRAAGIKGIRYKDAGSRGKDEGTSNYVVFDDNIIDIIRKYGIAGLLGAGGLASAAGGEAKAGQR